MMKRIFATVTVLVMAISVLSACGEKQPVSSIPDGTALDTDTLTEEITQNTDLTAVNFDKETTLASDESEETSTVAASEETTAFSVPSTVAEIVEYFNLSVNKVKPTAKKIVKNYEKRTPNEDKIVLPAGLESTAESMMSSLMKDDTDPIVYETKEDITNEFIVPGQTYSSRLKPEWVKSATIADKGNLYVINIKLKDQKNPTAGNGIGAVCDVIEVAEVAEKASFVEKFTTDYYNCEITATIDKASGNVVHIRYTTPVALEMTVNMFGTHDGSVGFTFEKDYSITY